MLGAWLGLAWCMWDRNPKRDAPNHFITELLRIQAKSHIMDASDVLAELLWGRCNPNLRRALRWRRRGDVCRAVQAVRVRHFVEWFCGTGNLTTACSQQKMRVAWYDHVLHPVKMNLLTSAGFAYAIILALSIVPGGTAWFGVPCSTFVFMSRGHTKRTRRRPQGDTCRTDVREANIIAERVGFLIQILAMRKVYWILEQPLNSLFWSMPAMREAQRQCKVGQLAWQRRFLWMGAYGHELLKPTELMGVFPNLDVAWPTKRPLHGDSTSAYRRWRDASGRQRVAGRAGLKATEHYPVAFCREAARLIKAQL